MSETDGLELHEITAQLDWHLRGWQRAGVRRWATTGDETEVQVEQGEPASSINGNDTSTNVKAAPMELPVPRNPMTASTSVIPPKPEICEVVRANCVRSLSSDEYASRQAQLAELEQYVAKCALCQELAGSRTQTVFGVGNVASKLVFVGEAPGADEDRLGEPFVGRAGQLLTDIIYACGLTREHVYICNVLKCRPPGNRNPSPTEVENCCGFLEAQLEILQPEVVVGLGKFAVSFLMNQQNVPITRVRGNWTEYRGIPVMPTFHPSYLLRNPAGKKDVWADMKEVLKRFGVTL